MPSGSRLVASSRTPGTARNIASAVLAHAPSRCSQLSSTIRTSAAAAGHPAASRAGRRRPAGNPSARQWPRPPAPARRPRPARPATPRPGTAQPARPPPAAASRVLPVPPVPVSVTRRQDSTRARISASSRPRPTNVASWAGRLPKVMSGGPCAASTAAAAAPAPRRCLEQRPLRPGQAQRIGQQPGRVLAGGPVDAPLQITDRPRAEPRRLRQLLLGQPGIAAAAAASRRSPAQACSATGLTVPHQPRPAARDSGRRRPRAPARAQPPRKPTSALRKLPVIVSSH